MNINSQDEKMMSSSTEITLSRLREHFVVNLSSAAQRIVELRKKYLSGSSQVASLQEVRHICHKIAGTAATLGFPDLGNTASSIERLIIANSFQDDEIDAHLFIEIENIMSQMSAIISSARETDK